MEYNSLITNKKRNLITSGTYEKTLFLNLFTDWLDEAHERIIVVEGFVNSESIKLSFNSLYDIIIEIAERALFVEYKVFEENIKTSVKSTAKLLCKFEKKLLSVKYRKYLLDEYPELFRLVFININYFITNLNDIISYYINDFNEIKKIFDLKNSGIEYIKMGLGDRHNNNKSTTLLQLEGEKK
ncbi:DUF4135 domain-containing protein [Chryseobacterium sp. 3008163]|nr:DUF4135 domain-containing protein [Chryseobacterium sp. 3008163]